MFFEFHQNNSGGSFDFDAERGISANVIIEADNAREANEKLERIGGYFDDEGWRDCDTCGSRWYRVADRDGTEQPSWYGNVLKFSDEVMKTKYGTSMKRMGDKPEIFVHYADGRIVGTNS